MHSYHSLKTKKIAVVGASGNVGRILLNLLAEQGVPMNNVTALASKRSVGRSVSYGEVGVLKLQVLDSFDFKGTDIAFFAAGGSVAQAFGPKAVQAGAVVIDKSSHYRMDPEVPLVVPEVNGTVLQQPLTKGIIANPNCTTIPLVVALKALQAIAPLKRVVVSTYQSVSGAGKPGMDELYSQTKGSYTNTPITPQHFNKPIAFNVIPQIDSFLDDGETKEEWKMRMETPKILGVEAPLTATCVRVPVFIGHSLAVNIAFEGPITASAARAALAKEKAIQVVDRPEEMEYITPIECAGEDLIYVSRIRQDPTLPHGLSLWIACDNLRKGAALNALQIAACLP